MANSIGSFLVISIGVLVHFLLPSGYYDDCLEDGYSLSTFGSKTAYKYHGLKPAHLPQLSGYRLVHVNALFRHGARSPKADFIKEMREWAVKLHDSFPDLQFTFNSATDEDKILLPAGAEELRLLGERFRRLLPADFTSPDEVLLLSSDTDRTKDSAKAFAKSFFDPDVKKEPIPDSQRLRFFDDCARYRDEIRKNKSVLVEYYAFRDSPVMKQLLKEVKEASSGLLGLTTKDLADFHKMAGLEIAATTNRTSLPGWVRLFRPDHLYTLEYLHDLKQYWTKANPFPINYEQVCPLFGSILKQMRAAAMRDMLELAGSRSPHHGSDVDGLASHKTVLWFGHAESLLPLVIKLGLFNESEPAAKGGSDDFLRRSGLGDRLRRLQFEQPPVPNMFRSSHMIPFAGNIAFFLHHCPRGDVAGEKRSPSLEDYCLEVYLNEQIVDIALSLVEAPRPLPLDAFLEHFHGCLPDVYDKEALCKDTTTAPLL